MLVICLESSHARGMGHLFRCLRLARLLSEAGHKPLFLLNDHEPSLKLVAEAGHDYQVVEPADQEGGWESRVIRERGVTAWLNDRRETMLAHARCVKESGALLVSLDDPGPGAALTDLHVAPLAFDGFPNRPGQRRAVGEDEGSSVGAGLLGRRVLAGPGYMVLPPETERFRRTRRQIGKTLVCMGGSDTHGLTLMVAKLLLEHGWKADVLTGPGFEGREELSRLACGRLRILHPVPCLAELFHDYDLAVTAGGVTPFEACAAGLPCLLVAAEEHETAVGKFLHNAGAAIYLGFRAVENWPSDLSALPVEAMSRAGQRTVPVNGAHNVVREILELLRA